jgi:mono/diheme cytochrome c family protein
MKTSVLFFLFLFMGLVACDRAPSTYNEGAKLYEKQCANCHMDDGSGLEGLIPPLANADALFQMRSSVACIIRNGMEGPLVVNGVTYNNKMVGNKRLKAVDITNIINYINNAWGNKQPFLELSAVKKSLENCK